MWGYYFSDRINFMKSRRVYTFYEKLQTPFRKAKGLKKSSDWVDGLACGFFIQLLELIPDIWYHF